MYMSEVFCLFYRIIRQKTKQTKPNNNNNTNRNIS